jgi:hypothetical protein
MRPIALPASQSLLVSPQKASRFFHSKPRNDLTNRAWVHRSFKSSCPFPQHHRPAPVLALLFLGFSQSREPSTRVTHLKTSDPKSKKYHSASLTLAKSRQIKIFQDSNLPIPYFSNRAALSSPSLLSYDACFVPGPALRRSRHRCILASKKPLGPERCRNCSLLVLALSAPA